MTPVPLAEQSPAKRFLVFAYAVLVGLVPVPFLLMGTSLLGAERGALMTLIRTGMGLLLTAGSIALSVQVARAAGRKGAGHAAYVLTSLLVLVIFPSMGLVVNGLADDCTHRCEPNYRPLAIPEIFGLVPLHMAAAVAFFLSARRPEALSSRGEALLATALLGGIVLHVALAVQFVPAILMAVFILPVSILTPYLTLPLLAHALIQRLRARGHDALLLAQATAIPREVYYRESVPLEASALPGRPVHRPTLSRGLAGLPVLLGLHALVTGVIFGSPTGAVDAFLRTCSYPLSQLPVLPARDCHYLCTIAAQGHPGLVRPYRWGTRRGRPILVNRQLALANAFEDLLHERWPRLGGWARRTYDFLALPICGALRRRWLANSLYVLMKPAELLFMLVLLFCDPGDPEDRIERMYR